jgi:hypothetical protein
MSVDVGLQDEDVSAWPQLRANAEEVGSRLAAASAERAELTAKLAAADEARRRSRDTIKPLVHKLTLQRCADAF